MRKTRLADYVASFVADRGVRHVFGVPGGGAMHLNDAFGHQPRLTLVGNLHEQASAYAAEAYSRIQGGLGVALVTTGPGGTNAVSGVAAAWLDSIPMLVISGQVKRADLSGDSGVRQRGVQEVGIVRIVQSIVKYAVTVMDPATIRYHLEKAVHLARTGRPGPAWIDIPLDVQASQIDEDALAGYDPEADAESGPSPEVSEEALHAAVGRTIQLLNASERPVLLAGYGLRIAGAAEEVAGLVESLGIPVLSTWPAMDLLPEAHPLLVGRPGPLAPRGANFALQNSDFLLALGARIDLVLTGYAPEKMARAARKVVVDVDPAELRKLGNLVEVPVCADARRFVRALLARGGEIHRRDRRPWLERCARWKAAWPLVQPEHRRPGKVSIYHFTERLCEVLPEGALVVSGSSGSGIELFLLCYRAKARQRIFSSTALGAMGCGVPHALGACLAGEGRTTVCVDGDGGFQFNIQELQTVGRLGLPIKYFVLDNAGYASIRISQMRYFGRLSGADASSGLTLPDVTKVAAAYGLGTARIRDQDDLAGEIGRVLEMPGPVVCDVQMIPDEARAPAMISVQAPNGSMVSKPLEDLWPFLDRDEFRANMIVPPLEEA